MQLNMPKMGSGLPSIFNGSPTKVPPAMGRLKAAGSNVSMNQKGVKREVQSGNSKVERYAKTPKTGGVDVKA